MIQELSFIDDDFAIALQNVYKRWHEVLKRALEDAQSAGECSADFNSGDEALFIISSIEGSISSAKVFQDLSYYERSTRGLISYIKAL